MNTKIHIDNESTICIVKNPVYHSKTKHIEIRHHFIRDCYEKKLISVEKIHTDLNVADLLTKPFDGPLFNYLVVSIVIVSHSIFGFIQRTISRSRLIHNPSIYDSLVKQFWQTATARTLADGTQQINATIDSIEYTITEESVRRQLQLADASGINMLQNEEIFEGLQNIGYLTDRTFTFWKSQFTPQWRFLIHHILHCISSKSGGWDQFGSNIATALICLSTGRDFNFSKLIFDGMISNLKSKSKFLMYPRFLQMILNVQTENKNLFVPVLLTKKIFGNMKRSFQGIHRPLLPAMLTIDAGQPQPSAAPTPSQPVPTPSPSHVQITPPPISQPPPTLTQPVQSTSPPPQPSSVQPTSSPPPIQPVQTTSSPPITTIPDTQPTLPPSPQIPSPSYHDTEGPSFEPSYHMSPPPSHEPEIQTSRPSEESEQLRNLLDLVPRLESRVESLEKELSDTKQTLGTTILQLIEKVKKLENKLRKKRKSKETEDAEGQDQDIPSPTDQGNKFATPEKDNRQDVNAIKFVQKRFNNKKGAILLLRREQSSTYTNAAYRSFLQTKKDAIKTSTNNIQLRKSDDHLSKHVANKKQLIKRAMRLVTDKDFEDIKTFYFEDEKFKTILKGQVYQVSISMLLSRHFDGGRSSKVKYCFMSDFGNSEESLGLGFPSVLYILLHQTGLLILHFLDWGNGCGSNETPTKGVDGNLHGSSIGELLDFETEFIDDTLKGSNS
ncbi:hypothetical protein Tco_0917028 [Tanacetum coccineum]